MGYFSLAIFLDSVFGILFVLFSTWLLDACTQLLQRDYLARPKKCGRRKLGESCSCMLFTLLISSSLASFQG